MLWGINTPAKGNYTQKGTVVAQAGIKNEPVEQTAKLCGTSGRDRRKRASGCPVQRSAERICGTYNKKQKTVNAMIS
jgi:hypothetical protein